MTTAPAPIFVSSLLGSDANPGTRQAPVRSLARGYELLHAGGSMLLRPGDRWIEVFPRWNKSGTTIDLWEPGRPPTIYTDGRTAWSAGSAFLSDVTIRNLNLECGPAWSGVFGPNEDPPVGICMVGAGQRFTVENVTLHGFANGVIVQGFHYGAALPFPDVTLRGVTVFDPFLIGDSSPRPRGCVGAYLEQITGSLVIDRCAVVSSPANAARGSHVSHGYYIHESCQAGIARITGSTATGARCGFSIRCGGISAGNLAVDCGIGIAGGYQTPVTFTSFGDTVLGGADAWTGDALGFGLWLQNVTHGSVSGCLVAHKTGGTNDEPAACYVQPGSCGPIAQSGNITHNWPPLSNTPGVFPDPERTLERYCHEVRGSGFDYAPAYLARLGDIAGARAWVREGFSL